MTEEEKLFAAAIGQRLLWVRLLADKTQEEMVLSKKYQASYSRWENGQRIITISGALEVCRRLDISLDYIYRGHLTGVVPELAEQLLKLHPGELVQPPFYTGWRRDKDPP